MKDLPVYEIFIKNDLETELKNLKKYIKDRYTLDDLL